MRLPASPTRDILLFVPLFLGLVLAGCALPAPQSGQLLRSEPTPIAEALFQVRARHTDLVPVRVVFPSDAQGRPARPIDGSRLPALVFIHGGLVPPEDYLWLAEALASRGFVVALPSHPLELALSAPDNGRFARELLVSPPEDSLLQGLVDPARIAVAGHSLGGVVASTLALDGGFAALALFASYPNPADAPRVPSLAVPSLSLAGELDCTAPLPRVRDEASRLPTPSVFAVLQGVTHYQFTVSDQKDVTGGCTPAVPLDAAHERITEVLSRFLLAALAGRGTGADDIRQVPGTEVTVR
ncbi:alpha/beta hydrolase family protein [Archangium lipolyticum]|uniref:alpha/beta hydrolase family protein n=1 Tax=Archangium lipolyticum TaxID=2970465 RepID=UPI002149D7F0|nr:alpha/beta hydrolase [Archangium lipolyticum]